GAAEAPPLGLVDGSCVWLAAGPYVQPDAGPAVHAASPATRNPPPATAAPRRIARLDIGATSAGAASGTTIWEVSVVMQGWSRRGAGPGSDLRPELAGPGGPVPVGARAYAARRAVDREPTPYPARGRPRLARGPDPRAARSGRRNAWGRGRG